VRVEQPGRRAVGGMCGCSTVLELDGDVFAVVVHKPKEFRYPVIRTIPKW
jgi:hypothetical protein